ncbi:hypothetical protein AWI28_18405 [Enterobacter genomosp. O]|uniref:Uncharacterized protein n=1 Tax=Enterobacter genomosp. O TaxID=2364150 RepID=A0A0X4EML9_9ENTR|nr:hypothetical protein AWI28_18405 [Enterobacter genomosp. O]
MKMVKTVGSGLGSLNVKTNWRVESTIARSKQDIFKRTFFVQRIHSSTLFSLINLKSAIIFALNKYFHKDDSTFM